ncbi:hypothetical protein C8F01DRAFT_1338768 [Mycena amicta]|nr:hypothetical protein C8F01DRAFT_1338768 [Mycena amicta]
MRPSHDIPPELFNEIAQRCSPSTLAVLCRVSRRSHSIAEHHLYSCVEIPQPRNSRETMNRILHWSHMVLKHQHLALRLHVFSFGSRRPGESWYAGHDEAHNFGLALGRCVNLKKFSILVHQLPLSVRDTCQRLLNDQDLKVVSLLDNDALVQLRSHALIAVHASGPQSILPAKSTSWKLERAFVQLTLPISDVATLATHANTLRVLTLHRTRGLGLRLDALITLLASHLPLLVRLNIVEAEPSYARRDEGTPQEALKGFTALESFVLHLKVAVPDPRLEYDAIASSRMILPRNQVTFQPSSTSIMEPSVDHHNSVCGLAPSASGLKDMAYRLLRSRKTLLHVEIGIQMTRKGGGPREEAMSYVLQRITAPKKVVGYNIKFEASEDFFES